jgi:hypothetical protein
MIKRKLMIESGLPNPSAAGENEQRRKKNRNKRKSSTQDGGGAVAGELGSAQP